MDELKKRKAIVEFLVDNATQDMINAMLTDSLSDARWEVVIVLAMAMRQKG